MPMLGRESPAARHVSLDTIKLRFLGATDAEKPIAAQSSAATRSAGVSKYTAVLLISVMSGTSI